MEFTNERYRYKSPKRNTQYGTMRDPNISRMDFSQAAAARVGWGREENDAKNKERVARRHPVTVQQPEKTSVFSAQGIRWDAASALLLVILAIFGLLLVFEGGNMIATQKRVEELQAEYDRVIASNQEMEANLSRQTNASTIGYQAVNVGLISTTGAKPISLTVPEEAMMTMPALGSTGI